MPAQVILFDPMYDSYTAMAVRAGATPVPVQLDASNSWRVPHEALAAAFSPKTKLILVNTPNNPTGAVFEEEDLREIARLCVEHDVIAVCDEVYEHLVFGTHKHVTLRSMPGMRERCLRIGSAGKTFSFTGWKVELLALTRMWASCQIALLLAPGCLHYARSGAGNHCKQARACRACMQAHWAQWVQIGVSLATMRLVDMASLY